MAKSQPPKPKARPKDKEVQSERYLSKAEREQYYQRIAVIVTVGIVALVVGIIAVALIVDTVVVPGQWVSKVNDEEITTAEFQDRIRTERWYRANQVREAYKLLDDDWQQTQVALANDPSFRPTNPLYQTWTQMLEDSEAEAFGAYVLDQMELQILLEKEAEQRGIKIDEALIEVQVDEYITSFTGANLTPTPTFTSTAIIYPSTTPVISVTPSYTPSATSTATVTPIVTVDGSTATPVPTNTATATLPPTNTPVPTINTTLITLTPAETETPLPNADQVRATIDTFEKDFYNDAEERADLDREALRDIFYLQALQLALFEDVTKDVATQEVWAEVRHILISPLTPEELADRESLVYREDLCLQTEGIWADAKAEADQVYAQLLAGEPFAALAELISDDETSAAQGGFLPFVSTEGYAEKFREVANTTELGVYNAPVCTQFGWYIIQVTQREIRDIDANTLQQTRSDEYEEWQNDLLANANIERRENWEERITDSPSYDDLLGDITPDE